MKWQLAAGHRTNVLTQMHCSPGRKLDRLILLSLVCLSSQRNLGQSTLHQRKTLIEVNNRWNQGSISRAMDIWIFIRQNLHSKGLPEDRNYVVLHPFIYPSHWPSLSVSQYSYKYVLSASRTPPAPYNSCSRDLSQQDRWETVVDTRNNGECDNDLFDDSFHGPQQPFPLMSHLLRPKMLA